MEPPYVLDPIGQVRHDHPADVLKDQWHSLTTLIEIRPDLEDGLLEIDGFSHLIVLFWMPTIGVFACDAPPRPNPIGLTVVELLGRDGPTLEVRGLDAYSGTPVLDLKPYTNDRLVPDLKESGWHADLIRKTGARRV